MLTKLLRTFRFPLWLLVWGGCIAAIKCTGLLCGLVRHGRVLTEHTALNKLCGLLLFALPLCIGRFPPATALLLPTCVLATAAAIQEYCYIYTGRELR